MDTATADVCTEDVTGAPPVVAGVAPARAMDRRPGAMMKPAVAMSFFMMVLLG